MHQVLSLRPFWNEKKGKWDKSDAHHFGRKWRFKSLPELFRSLPEFMKQIPEADRWNLYYTVAFCGDGKREFREQSIIVFDIDKIDKARIGEYLPLVCEAAGVKLAETGVVSSGHGLHFIIALKQPIVDPTYFDKTSAFYKAYCTKIKAVLAARGLAGEPDPSVWEARRIMRLPGTINRKEGLPDVDCHILQPSISEVDFDLTRGSGLPEVSASEQIAPQTMKKHPTPDTEAILEGCNSLKWMRSNQAEVSEHQWYAMLSVVARLPPDGRTLAHEFSHEHPGYSRGETDAKIDQALAASGPRTCDNFDKLAGKCQGCKYAGKVTSPIQIQGASYIRTEQTGFHDIKMDSNGMPAGPGKPNYEDLRRFFERDHRYVTLGESGVCLTWAGTHWKEYKDRYLEAFAQDHFNPKAQTYMTTEFKNLVCRTNLRDTEWFINTTHRKVNFKNGVLDLETMQMVPHSRDSGFRYVLDYNYDPEAKAPVFERFMLDIMKGRRDLVAALLEYMGYAFSNDRCWAQKALIMTGHGSNGKSTLMTVMQKLAGKENYSSLTLTNMKMETSRKMLDGKLFNLAEETPTQGMADSSEFKNAVSGGDMVVKQLYKQPYTIPIRAKLMFACNELPRTKDTTRGYFRRLLIVPFDRDFENDPLRDPFINDKLDTELSGIFNLVIAGYARLKSQKAFTISETMTKQIQEYRSEIDSVLSWYEACVRSYLKDPDSTINTPLSALYQSYRLYTERSGEKPETKHTVARRLKHILDRYDLRHSRETVEGVREPSFKGVGYADASKY